MNQPEGIPQHVRNVIVRVHSTQAADELTRLRPHGDRYEAEPLASGWLETYAKARAVAESSGWDWEAIVNEVREDAGFDEHWLQGSDSEYRSYLQAKGLIA